MTNSAFILTLAYPETVVMHADEWYSPLMRYIGIGNKKYVRAGHAALVLISKETGELEYHDFGRYITPEPYGRVRGKTTDCELDFPLKAQIEGNIISNLNEILTFLGTHPKLTHGDGKLIASVCDEIDYAKARSHITRMQNRNFIRYAAFIKNACNCARFVTDTLIASITNKTIKNRLKRSKKFTPSTVGNVVIANTQEHTFEVSESGEITPFNSSVKSENVKAFLDRLHAHEPGFIGTLEPKLVSGLHEKAQWLPGIAAGAWFELHKNGSITHYRFKRISPYGNIDVDAIYKVCDTSFEYELKFEFIQYSNCAYFHIRQNKRIYRFDRVAIN